MGQGKKLLQWLFGVSATGITAGFEGHRADEAGRTAIQTAQAQVPLAQHALNQTQTAITNANNSLPGALKALDSANSTVKLDQAQINPLQNAAQAAHGQLTAAQQTLMQDQHGNLLQQLKATFVDSGIVNAAQDHYNTALKALNDMQHALTTAQATAGTDAGIVNGYQQTIANGPGNISVATDNLQYVQNRAGDIFNTYVGGALQQVARDAANLTKHIPVVGTQIVNSPAVQNAFHAGHALLPQAGTITLVATLPVALVATYVVGRPALNAMYDAAEATGARIEENFTALLNKINTKISGQQQQQEPHRDGYAFDYSGDTTEIQAIQTPAHSNSKKQKTII